MTTRMLSTPIPVHNADNTPNSTGTITEVVDLILRYQNHLEHTLFTVTGLGSQNLILGHSWLQNHNPEIDWATGEVEMSRCPGNCCSGCCEEIKEEWKVKKAEAWGVAACMAGDLPELIQDDDEEDENEDDPELEEGDCLFATGLNDPPEEVQATSTISQRLGEAFKQNAVAARPDTDECMVEGIPDHLREFQAMFFKESFDILPDHKPWDHAIKLVPGEKLAGCKVYPLSPSKQKELDAFIQGT